MFSNKGSRAHFEPECCSLGSDCRGSGTLFLHGGVPEAYGMMDDLWMGLETYFCNGDGQQLHCDVSSINFQLSPGISKFPKWRWLVFVIESNSSEHGECSEHSAFIFACGLIKGFWLCYGVLLDTNAGWTDHEKEGLVSPRGTRHE